MGSLAALLALSTSIYAATNIDGLFVLMAFYADPAYRSPQIVAGQLLGTAVLVAASLAAALAARAFPPGAVGWLGLVPLALGANKLWDLRRTPPPPGPVGAAAEGRFHGKILAVGAVAVATGGDNIAIYAPQFALHPGGDTAVMALAFTVLTGLWCLLARAILSHPTVGRAARMHGRWLVPCCLIVIGLLTLYQAGIWPHR